MAGHVAVGQVLIPAWIVKAVVGTIITLSLGGAAAWTTHLSAVQAEHTVEITVIQERERRFDKDVEEIKDSQKEINKKLDRLLIDRRPR